MFVLITTHNHDISFKSATFIISMLTLTSNKFDSCTCTTLQNKNPARINIHSDPKYCKLCINKNVLK